MTGCRTDRELRILGSTGCQSATGRIRRGEPVVAGSPARNIFARAIHGDTHFPDLGKLPRPTGWQPVLPRETHALSATLVRPVTPKPWRSRIRGFGTKIRIFP